MNPAKEYLGQIKSLDCKIRRRQQEAEELREAAMRYGSTTPDPDRIRSPSSDPDPMASQVSRYVDMQREVDAMILELMDLKHTILGQIQGLEDRTHMEILWKRYVDLEGFGQIAEDMCCSLRTVFRIHGRALQAFNAKFISCH